jgi:hypothetical protein
VALTFDISLHPALQKLTMWRIQLIVYKQSESKSAMHTLVPFGAFFSLWSSSDIWPSLPFFFSLFFFFFFGIPCQHRDVVIWTLFCSSWYILHCKFSQQAFIEQKAPWALCEELWTKCVNWGGSWVSSSWNSSNLCGLWIVLSVSSGLSGRRW